MAANRLSDKECDRHTSYEPHNDRRIPGKKRVIADDIRRTHESPRESVVRMLERWAQTCACNNLRRHMDLYAQNVHRFYDRTNVDHNSIRRAKRRWPNAASDRICCVFNLSGGWVLGRPSPMQSAKHRVWSTRALAFFDRTKGGTSAARDKIVRAKARTLRHGTCS